MEKRGKKVTLKSMKESLHCAHYRTYPDEYRDACIVFINRSTDPRQGEKASPQKAEIVNPEDITTAVNSE